METYNFGPVLPITFKEVKRLYGQACQIKTIHQYWITGNGWVDADFTESVESQILRVILMGASVVNLEIHHHGQVSYADYLIRELQEKTE
ncbi:hypothetical protein [Salmonirosea aquatica]|uniref:Uncharacterized protein n=1 Tax=Salmonirosea aquatica TaxID=2654236 RepID=A0A7C9BMB8_9BACT|nr:hypothetical protein [Cytophagaceae bacterium SJW1-29]